MEHDACESGDHPFGFLDTVEPGQLALSLSDEHPQTIALVLCFLSPEKVVGVMAQLETDLRYEVSTRIASMGSVSPEVIAVVQDGLRRKMTPALEAERSSLGGAAYLARVLNQADPDVGRAILDGLDLADSGVAEQVRRSMCRFEDIARLDDRKVQRLLRSLDRRDLVLALKDCDADVRAAVDRNLSTRAAGWLREDLSKLGPAPQGEVEAARERIAGAMRNAALAGERGGRSGDRKERTA